jgi:formylglycine-generating enzyme required for sulfatase activity
MADPLPPTKKLRSGLVALAIAGGLFALAYGGIVLSQRGSDPSPTKQAEPDSSQGQPAEPKQTAVPQAMPAGNGPTKPELLAAPFDAPAARDAQRRWAAYLGVPIEQRLDLGDGVPLPVILVPPGSFQMGSDNDDAADDEERPAHRVTIDFPLQVGKYEVTIRQFNRFVTARGNYKTEAERGQGGWGLDYFGDWKQDAKFTWQHPGYPVTADHPVANVSWNDAQAFVHWLSQRSGKKVRLLREAEWEYSCRAGTTTVRYNGDDEERLAKIGNVADAAARERFKDWTTIQANDGYVFTAPVGKFEPNTFGLYDMIGNVWEWCEDPKRLYTAEQVTNPLGAGLITVLRGGAFNHTPRGARAACRGFGASAYWCGNLGFRVVVLR